MGKRLQPWDRQDDESDQAWAAFVFYRDLESDRSIRKVATKTGHSTRTIAWHSTNHGWVERCRAYDREVDGVRVKATLSETEKMHRRHIRLSQQLQDFAAIELRRLLRRIGAADQEGDDDCGPITAPDKISQAAERGVKIERMARGESSEVVEQKHDLSRLSVEDLRTLKRIKKKMEGE